MEVISLDEAVALQLAKLLGERRVRNAAVGALELAEAECVAKADVIEQLYLPATADDLLRATRRDSGRRARLCDAAAEVVE